MNKYKILTEFIAENYKPLNDWMYFNAITSEDGNVSLNTMESAIAVNMFNDGSREVNLLFAISMIKQYDMEMSQTNLEAINEVDHFIKWIYNQNMLRNFPDMGEDITVFDMEVLDSVPSVSVDSEQNLAKYQFNCSLNYLERK